MQNKSVQAIRNVKSFNARRLFNPRINQKGFNLFFCPRLVMLVYRVYPACVGVFLGCTATGDEQNHAIY